MNVYIIKIRKKKKLFDKNNYLLKLLVLAEKQRVGKFRRRKQMSVL